MLRPDELFAPRLAGARFVAARFVVARFVAARFVVARDLPELGFNGSRLAVSVRAPARDVVRPAEFLVEGAVTFFCVVAVRFEAAPRCLESDDFVDALEALRAVEVRPEDARSVRSLVRLRLDCALASSATTAIPNTSTAVLTERRPAVRSCCLIVLTVLFLSRKRLVRSNG